MKPILDFIARYEVGGAASRQGVTSEYDVVHGLAYRALPPEPRLELMTVDQVLAWQARAIRAHRERTNDPIGYSAAGRYQVIRATLLDLVGRGVLSRGDRFDAAGQDACAAALLRQAGWTRWEAGQLADDAMADAIARVWASLPLASGRGAYDGDRAGNMAHAKRAEFMAALRACRAPQAPAKPVEDVEPFPSLLGSVLAIIRSLFRRSS